MASADEIEELLRARMAELEPYVSEYRRLEAMLGSKPDPPRLLTRPAAPRRPADGGRLVERVVEVIGAAEEPLRARAVLEHLAASGYEYSWIAVSNSMHYAERLGYLRRVRRGLYTLREVD